MSAAQSEIDKPTEDLELESESRSEKEVEIPQPESAYGGELDAKPLAVAIFEQWCKGCELCVHFCPKDVLAMNAHGKAVVVKPEACIQCALCWVHCPDFAIVSLVK